MRNVVCCRTCDAGYTLPLVCLGLYAQVLTQVAFIPVLKTLMRSLDCSQLEGLSILQGNSPLDSPWRWNINPSPSDQDAALHFDPTAGEKLEGIVNLSVNY